MKTFVKSLAFAALTAGFFSACDTDPCKDVVCGDHGTCVEGTCVCTTGYEKGSTGLCDTEQRAKFLSNAWAVSDSCSSSGASGYTAAIITSTASVTDVRISNFWDQFTGYVNASVSGSTITIARQAPDNDGFYVQGSGTISGSTIAFSYTITDETDTTNISTDACSSVWTK